MKLLSLKCSHLNHFRFDPKQWTITTTFDQMINSLRLEYLESKSFGVHFHQVYYILCFTYYNFVYTFTNNVCINLFKLKNYFTSLYSYTQCLNNQKLLIKRCTWSFKCIQNNKRVPGLYHNLCLKQSNQKLIDVILLQRNIKPILDHSLLNYKFVNNVTQK